MSNTESPDSPGFLQNNTTFSQSGATNLAEFDLSKMIKEMFMVLTEKEQDVITRRFSLNNQPKQTLEKIGESFSVTRERVRQIENIALSKLRRTINNTKFYRINKLAKEIITQRGGIMLEEELISEMLSVFLKKGDADSNIIKLSMVIDSELTKQDKSDVFFPFWSFNTISIPEARQINDSCISLLKKKTDVIEEAKIVSELKGIFSRKEMDVADKTLLGALSIDKRLKKVESGWGLIEWRHINPRSIRDKAYIVLKNAKKPLHFVEIANRISEVGFDRKVVTVQAVHNELIRCEKFVLVGRGLYVLKEWGYKEGTVADVIEDILNEKGEPMTKQEIIEAVLKQRHVRIGTISLNLQKNPHFIRVGRAVYDLDMKQKPKATKKKTKAKAK
ncbi:MAG: sigma factor-like helix-turn-helix DNA-binding protein [Candidatus Gracilibacteria bacterium]|nr:sigma factor-like helix-turn-helix DNA-binding protein [Candidatus Gracilibacteria bacterium]